MPEDRDIVWISHRGSDRCEACGVEIFGGDFVQVNARSGIRCLECSEWTNHVFLPSGDTALTRRATKYSERHAVVVKFSRARKRSERQGVLVEEQALERAQAECEKDAPKRNEARVRRRARDEVADRAYVKRFAERITALLPGCPKDEAEVIAQHACRKYSGRVGRTQAAKEFDEDAIVLAVRAYIRHHHTQYDQLLSRGMEPADARSMIADALQAKLDQWCESEMDQATS